LNVAHWLLQIKPDINISAEYEYAFPWACINGHLNVAQWLLQVKPDINISANNEYAFQFTCNNGHLNVAQWLLQVKPDINISANNEYAFRFACRNGNLNVALYLQTLLPFKYNIQVENDKIISWKINTEYKEKLLFILYSLTCKGFANELYANLVMDMGEYL